MPKGERLQDAAPGRSGEPDLPYEQAVEELEAIIERIESGEIGLEESLAEYERGTHLIRRCRAVLDRAEQKIMELDAKASAAAADEARKAEDPEEPCDDEDDAPF